jgi:hypothetical protein
LPPNSIFAVRNMDHRLSLRLLSIDPIRVTTLVYY